MTILEFVLAFIGFGAFITGVALWVRLTGRTAR